jgi:hypothetical protein
MHMSVKLGIWHLVLRETYRLSLSENGVLRKMFGPNEIVVGHTTENRNAYRILVGKPEINRPLGRSSHR